MAPGATDPQGQKLSRLEQMMDEPNLAESRGERNAKATCLDSGGAGLAWKSEPPPALPRMVNRRTARLPRFALSGGSFMLFISSMQSSHRPDIHSESFLHLLMRRQLRLSILSCLAFMLMLLGLPLANYLAPEFMARRVLGFTLSWLILGLGFFPTVWLVSWVFTRRSMALEEQEVREVQPQAPPVQVGAVPAGRADG